MQDQDNAQPYEVIRDKVRDWWTGNCRHAIKTRVKSHVMGTYEPQGGECADRHRARGISRAVHTAVHLRKVHLSVWITAEVRSPLLRKCASHVTTRAHVLAF
jgi:hypothetical protein